MRAYKLTRKQKMLIAAAAPCLNVDNWLMVTESADKITIKHKISGNTKVIIKK